MAYLPFFLHGLVLSHTKQWTNQVFIIRFGRDHLRISMLQVNHSRLRDNRKSTLQIPRGCDSRFLAALKQLKQERIKKYNYCLPYIYSPLKEDETVDETVVNVMNLFDDEAKPPVVVDFYWQFDEFEEFVNNLVTEEELPGSEREKFMVFLKDLVGKEKNKVREAKQARKKALEEMSKDLLEGFQSMKFYKFYPTKSKKYPDISKMKSSFINIYYGKATEVL